MITELGHIILASHRIALHPPTQVPSRADASAQTLRTYDFARGHGSTKPSSSQNSPLVRGNRGCCGTNQSQAEKAANISLSSWLIPSASQIRRPSTSAPHVLSLSHVLVCDELTRKARSTPRKKLSCIYPFVGSDCDCGSDGPAALRGLCP